MNVLILCHRYPNYVPDLFLQGLRKVIGAAAVDFPRKDVLYQGILGQPFLEIIPDLMPDDSDVDRFDVAAKLRRGFYDLVVCDVRAFAEQRALLQESRTALALIDGEDRPVRLPPGRFVVLRRETDGRDGTIPLPMGMPTEILAWIDRHSATPKTHTIGFLGSRSKQTPDRNAVLDALVKLFPDCLIDSWQFSGGDWKGRDAYYRHLQSCKIVLNLPGAGYDTFRYWENAACNAAHIAKRMPLFIPDDYRDGQEIVRFTSVSELSYAVERILSDQVDWRALAEQSRTRLLAHHTTQRRAEATLDRLKATFRH